MRRIIIIPFRARLLERRKSLRRSRLLERRELLRRSLPWVRRNRLVQACLLHLLHRLQSHQLYNHRQLRVQTLVIHRPYPISRLHRLLPRHQWHPVRVQQPLLVFLQAVAHLRLQVLLRHPRLRHLLVLRRHPRPLKVQRVCLLPRQVQLQQSLLLLHRLQRLRPHLSRQSLLHLLRPQALPRVARRL